MFACSSLPRVLTISRRPPASVPPVPPWETDPAQSPLLVAYDQRITELEAQASQYKARKVFSKPLEFSAFLKKCQSFGAGCACSFPSRSHSLLARTQKSQECVPTRLVVRLTWRAHCLPLTFFNFSSCLCCSLHLPAAPFGFILACASPSPPLPPPHSLPFFHSLLNCPFACRSTRSENTKGSHAKVVEEGDERHSEIEITHLKRSHHSSVGADDEHVVAVILAKAGQDIHEGERAAHTDHGLRGSLAPVVGHQRHVVHQASVTSHPLFSLPCPAHCHRRTPCDTKRSASST